MADAEEVVTRGQLENKVVAAGLLNDEAHTGDTDNSSE